MPKVSDVDLERRRSQILDAARTCFAEYGYEGATVRRLEEATGRTRGAIFHHFGDKQGLFFELAREDAIHMADIAASHGLIDVMRNIVDNPDGYQWALTQLEVGRLVRTDPSFRCRWNSEHKRIDDAVRRRVSQQIDDGVMRTDVSPETICSLLIVVFDGVLSAIGAGDTAPELPLALNVLEDSLRK